MTMQRAKILRSATLITLACAGVLLAGHAWAQIDSREGIALQNQILELRRDLDNLRAQGGGGGGGVAQPVPLAPAAPSSDLNAALLDRVTRLEDDVRQLRGRLDESENARQRLAEDLGKRIDDLQFRLGTGPGQPAASSGAPSAGSSIAPPPVPPAAPAVARRTPEMALQEGYAALGRRDYAQAEAAAREVLASGRGPRAADGQYLLAQSMAGRRDYQGAAVAFDDAYNRNPRGGRAQESLIGLANSLAAINEKPAACQTLAKLRAEFPTVRPDLRPAIAAARQRAACG